MDKELHKKLELLKFDYWQKNDKFKSLWRYYRARKLDPSTPFPDQFKKDKIKYEPSAPPYFLATREYWLFWLYHDPETASFKDYWEFKEKVRSEFKTVKNIYIEDYRELISKDFEIAIERVKSKKNRSPKINEVKECLVDWLLDSRSIYLKINQYEFTKLEAKTILKEVTSILNKRTYDARPHLQWIRDYLTAWELQQEQGKSLVEIYDKVFGKGHDVTKEEKQQYASRYIQHAKIIMDNLEARKFKWWEGKCKQQNKNVKRF